MDKKSKGLIHEMARSAEEKQLKFELFYKKLIQYKTINGNFFGVTTDPEIGSIVSRIRASYKGKKGIELTPEMIEKLNAIGFTWKAGYGKWFDSFYKKLVLYKNKNGSFYGVTKDKEIGFYVSYIRSGFLKIDETMVERLNEIGFTWKAEYGLWFEEFYKKLIDYKKVNGNFKGITTIPGIASTVHSVRAAYRGYGKLKLTQEMIDKLKAIDFPLERQNKDARINGLEI